MSISVDPDWWKNIFDDVYLITDARSVCDPRLTAREVDLVCEMLHPQEDEAILDLCGGHGRHTLELCSRGFRCCTLVDYSAYLTEHAKKEAKERNLDIRVLRADARTTGLSSGSFDCVIIMGNSLGYIFDPDSDLEILLEAHRVLAAEGKLLVDVTNCPPSDITSSPSAWHEIGKDIVVCRLREVRENRVFARELVLSKERGMIRDQTYSIRLYEPRTIRLLMEKAGFERIEVRTDFSPHEKVGDYGCMNNRMVALGFKC
jgi:D-alanine-D-alanine ligase